jgi:hypothetical protein
MTRRHNLAVWPRCGWLWSLSCLWRPDHRLSKRFISATFPFSLPSPPWRVSVGVWSERWCVSHPSGFHPSTKLAPIKCPQLAQLRPARFRRNWTSRIRQSRVVRSTRAGRGARPSGGWPVAVAVAASAPRALRPRRGCHSARTRANVAVQCSPPLKRPRHARGTAANRRRTPSRRAAGGEPQQRRGGRRPGRIRPCARSRGAKAADLRWCTCHGGRSVLRVKSPGVGRFNPHVVTPAQIVVAAEVTQTATTSPNSLR